MMKQWMVWILAAALALASPLGMAAGNGLDLARDLYMSAQANFIDSMGNPEKTLNGGRNFMRYLAKIQAAKNQLDQTEAAYKSQLKSVLKEDARYDDRAYREVQGLQQALGDYAAIREEVGEATISEAAAAYAEEFR